jgi:hypothetical protein
VGYLREIFLWTDCAATWIYARWSSFPVATRFPAGPGSDDPSSGCVAGAAERALMTSDEGASSPGRAQAVGDQPKPS